MMSDRSLLEELTDKDGEVWTVGRNLIELANLMGDAKAYSQVVQTMLCLARARLEHAPLSRSTPVEEDADGSSDTGHGRVYQIAQALGIRRAT
jgi:hypothetical protein